MKFCAIHFAKLLTRFPFSEQVHCQSKHPVEQALPSIYDSAGGRFPRQASNFVKQSSNSNMKHHEENVLSSKPNFVNRFRILPIDSEELAPFYPMEIAVVRRPAGDTALRWFPLWKFRPKTIAPCARSTTVGRRGSANFGRGTGPRRD